MSKERKNVSNNEKTIVVRMYLPGTTHCNVDLLL